VFLWARIDAVKQLAAVSADGCPVSAYDEGDGQAAVIIVGGAGDDGRGHARLAAKLTSTNRVLRLIRRQYRTDLAAWRPVNVTDEAADVVALARTTGRPCYLFGHSSGGVIALEAALIAPESFAALAVFEPPIGETPLPPATATHAARQAIDAGRPEGSLFESPACRGPTRATPGRVGGQSVERPSARRHDPSGVAGRGSRRLG
jgi:pimeloyl-ACP methyl ester carboxylesterase